MGVRSWRQTPTSRLMLSKGLFAWIPKNAVAYRLRGRASHINGDYEQALSNYHTAVRYIRPFVSTPYSTTNVDALLNRAETYAAQGNYLWAVADFSYAVDLNPSSLRVPQNRRFGARIYNGLGQVYVEEGDHEFAIRHFRKAAEVDSKGRKAFHNIATAFEARGQVSQAARHLEIFYCLQNHKRYGYGGPRGEGPDQYADLEIEDRVSIRTERGKVHARKGNYDLAIAWHNSAISLNPLEETTYHNRGASYLGAGSYVQAVADFNTAIGLSASDSGDPSTLGERTVAYLAIGDDPSAAIPFLKRGLSYMAVPQEGPYEDDLEFVSLRKEADDRGWPLPDADEKQLLLLAKADFDTALHFDPRNVEAYRARGTAYQFLGADELAQADFATADNLGGS